MHNKQNAAALQGCIQNRFNPSLSWLCPERPFLLSFLPVSFLYSSNVTESDTFLIGLFTLYWKDYSYILRSRQVEVKIGWKIHCFHIIMTSFVYLYADKKIGKPNDTTQKISQCLKPPKLLQILKMFFRCVRMCVYSKVSLEDLRSSAEPIRTDKLTIDALLEPFRGRMSEQKA